MEVFTPPPYREARSPGRPTKLTPEARLSIAQKVMSKDMTYRQAAKDFGISPGAVGACVRLYKKEGANSKRNERVQEYNKTSDEYRHQAQLKELKQEIAELYLQNQMLKKIVSKSLLIKKSNGSVGPSPWDPVRGTQSVITTENLAQLQRDVE